MIDTSCLFIVLALGSETCFGLKLLNLQLVGSTKWILCDRKSVTLIFVLSMKGMPKKPVKWGVGTIANLGAMTVSSSQFRLPKSLNIRIYTLANRYELYAWKLLVHARRARTLIYPGMTWSKLYYKKNISNGLYKYHLQNWISLLVSKTMWQQF
jgi:hypothetical protein